MLKIKSETLKVVIQFAFLRACWKNKNKDYTSNIKWEWNSRRGEIEEWARAEREERACLSFYGLQQVDQKGGRLTASLLLRFEFRLTKRFNQTIAFNVWKSCFTFPRTSPWHDSGFCRIVEYIFIMSLNLGKVPLLWKSSCMVPVPNIPHPKDFNSYRPVALTSHLMKTLERLVLVHLCPLVGPFMDPLQFAYQPGTGVDDANIFLLDRSLSHLEKPGSTVRIMFFNFSSAFNTIQPALLGDKLGLAGVNQHLTSWILDYLN